MQKSKKIIPISSKNQVTLPKKWTRSLNIEKKVNIELMGSIIIITPIKTEDKTGEN